MLHNDHPPVDCAHLLNAGEAVQRLLRSTALWHETSDPAIAEEDTLLRLHLANFTLWHMEDQARDPAATDASVAELKRNIDRTNQARNDFVEQLDTSLLQALRPSGLPRADAPLHSETPGLMLDRLSILALKIFHTDEETHRPDATALHRERNQQRKAVLQQQSADLTACLSTLWQQVCEGSRSYRLYQQMKMYNDPDLNPVLYATAPNRTELRDA